MFSTYVKVHRWVRIAARLRRVCKKLHDSFSLDFFLSLSGLVEREKWSKKKVWDELRWFCTIPPFQDDYSRFPFFRQRGAFQRLVQGFLRQLYVTKHEECMYLVGLVQPSVSWSAKHLVFFRCVKEELVFERCWCRNGCVWELSGCVNSFSTLRKAAGCVHCILVMMAVENVRTGRISVVWM